MMFNIDFSREPEKPSLYIAKPNREIVGVLSEAYDIQNDMKVGNIPQLSFKIPYTIDVRHKLVKNEHIQHIKNRYLIKLVYNNIEEWYIIKNPSDNMTESADYKEVEAYGLAYQLSDKNIRNYKATSINATTALQAALSGTNWTVGNVDVTFDVIYRSFDITNSNALDFIFQIATTFNALVDFDTVNRQVNFLIFENYGIFRGLEVSYGNLLKTAKKVESTDEFITRLKVFGANGISIQGENLTGSNYIENYSYFLYGFQRDENKNVLSHSEYMSDSLCGALLDYQELIASSEGTFQTYLSQLETEQATLISQQNTLTTLQNELEIIEDNIAVANYNGEDTSDLVTQKNNKLTEISNQNAAIATTQNNINAINTNIDNLRATLSVESNFTPEQIEEWQNYIIEGVYENTNISDPKQLLAVAEKEFEKLKEPKIVVEINMVNLLDCIEEQDRWDKLKLGDVIRIKNVILGLDVMAKIIEMRFNHETNDIDVVISNVKELLTDKERFLRDLYRANTTSTVVNSNNWRWEDAYNESNEISTIINNEWDATKRKIIASNENTVEISRKGIIIKDLNNPTEYLVLNHGVVAITNDDGNTWKNALTSRGLVAERVYGVLGAFAQLRANQIILGVNGEKIGDSLIQSSNAWNTAAIQAGNSVQLGTAYNNVVITQASGIVTTRSDVLSRTIMSGSGFAVQKNVGTAASPNWQNRFYTDANGDLIVTGNINATSGTFSGNITATGTITGGTITGANFNNGAVTGSTLTIGSGNSIFKADTNGIYLGNATFGSAPFRVNMAGQFVATSATISGNITMTGGSISWANVNSDPVATNAASAASTAQATADSIAAGTYAGGTFIDKKIIWSPEIRAGTITANSTINVGTDATIGNYIYLIGAGGGNRGVIFSGNASITTSGDTIVLSSLNGISIPSGRIILRGSDLEDRIDAKATKNSDTDSYTVGNHNHGITPGRYIMTYDSSGAELGLQAWVASGGFTHSHNQN